jgi:hypothetical protein
MSLESEPLRLPLERITDSDFLHRVQRDERAKDFGQKQQHDSRGGKHSDHPAEEETPQDVVDVSEDYLHGNAIVITRDPLGVPRSAVVSTPPSRTVKPAKAASTESALLPEERHIDISV